LIRSSYFTGNNLFTVGEDGFLLKWKISHKTKKDEEKSLNKKRDISNDSTDNDESKKVSKKSLLKKKKFNQ